MGLTLVLFGAFLLVSELDAGGRALPFVSKWWAVIPVLLGVEILAAGFFSRGTNPPVRYDFFGMLVAFFVVVVSIGLQGLSVSGVLPAVQRSLGSMEYPADLTGETIPLDDAIHKIVVVSDSGEIEIRSSSEPQVTFFGRGRISALSREEASAMAAQTCAGTRREGDTLFISFGRPPESRAFGGHSSSLRWTLVVPANRDLEFSSSTRANVVVAGLAADWRVKTAGAVSVRLGSQENLTLQVRVPSPGHLAGEAIPWKDETAPARNAEGDQPVLQGPVTRTAVLGEGRYSLHVQGMGGVDVEM